VRTERRELNNPGSKVKTIRFVALLSTLSAALDLNISAQQTTTPSVLSDFIATVANTSPAPKPPPVGMVWTPGGEFWMGSDERQFPDARPWHRVYVDGFWMDQTEVTNEQFEKFVKARRVSDRAGRKSGRRLGCI